MGGALFTDPFAVGAVVTALIAAAFFVDRRFRVLSFFGTAILVITGAAVLVNLRVIPPSIPVGDGDAAISPIYVFAGEYAVPLAIVLLLMTADLGNIRRLGRPALLAFVLGAVGTAVGAFVAGLLLGGAIGPEAWKLSGQFTGSYIGGGVNYAAVGEAVDLSETLYATGAAADTLMTNLWFVVTALIPVVLLRFYPSLYGRGRPEDRDGTADDEGGAGGEYWEKREISVYDIVYLLAAAFAIVAVSTLVSGPLNGLLGFEVPVEILYTTLALLAAFTPANHLAGGEEIGNVLLHYFFAVLGAGAVLSTLVDKGPVVFLFLVVLVAIHGGIIFGVGRLLRIEIETLAVASQACVGGPSTALALAVSKGWRSLVAPAVLIGVLGYAVGNYAGVGMAYLLRVITG